MPDYISREAAAQILRKEAANHYPTPFHVGLLAAARVIEAIPAADVRPVVLCRDCVYLTRDKYGAWCFNNYEENLKDDDFCSRGVKQEEENDEKT